MILPYTEKMVYRILQRMANEQFDNNKVARYGIVQFAYNDIIDMSEGYFRNTTTVGNALHEIESRGEAHQLRRGSVNQPSVWDVTKFIGAPEPYSEQLVYEDPPKVKHIQDENKFGLPTTEPSVPVSSEDSELKKEVLQMRQFLSEMLPQMCNSLDNLAERASEASHEEVQALREQIAEAELESHTLRYRNEALETQLKNSVSQATHARNHTLEEELRLANSERDTLRKKNETLTQMITKNNIEMMTLNQMLEKMRSARFNQRELLKRRDAILDEIERFTIGATGRQGERREHFKRFVSENLNAMLKEFGLSETLPYQIQSK